MRALTPHEFIQALEGRMRAEQNDWERTRTLAAIVVQPYSKKRVNPRELLPMPWDKPTMPTQSTETQTLTPAQRRERVAELLKTNG